MLPMGGIVAFEDRQALATIYAALLSLQPNKTALVPALLWTSPISHLPSSIYLSTEQETENGTQKQPAKELSRFPEGSFASNLQPSEAHAASH